MKQTALTILLLGMLISCDPKRVFEDYQTYGERGWHKDSLAIFEIQVPDKHRPYNLYVNIRNKGDYPNSNIWLFLSVNSPNGKVVSDTLEFILAEPSGKWRGRGIGDLFDNQFLYRSNVAFPDSGHYTFTVRHGMRPTRLQGIHDVGVRVEKSF